MLKLFKVDVESFVYVLAQDNKKAEDFVTSCCGDLDTTEVVRGSWCSANEIHTVKELDLENGGDDLPYTYLTDRRDSSNAEIMNLTCKQIIELYEKRKEEIKRKAEIERYNDKVQMKLPLEGVKLEPDPIVCGMCGYSGPIETFDVATSMYNDVKCPKCGSTKNAHNSKYQEELLKGM